MADATTTIDARPGRRGRPEHVATITVTQLAAHLGLTRQRIAALVDENVLTRLPSGRFNETDSRLRCLNWLRDPARRSARSEADARFVDAKSELLRLRIAEKSRTLIPKHEVDETIDAIAGIVTTHLGGMAARCTPDLRISATIDAAVRQIRTEMATAAIRLADERREPPLDASRE